MSGQKSSKKKTSLDSGAIIAIQDLVLGVILSNGWKDHAGFARELSERILRKDPKTEKALLECVKRFTHPFYFFNKVKKQEFVQRFPISQILQRLSNLPIPSKIRETETIILSPSRRPKQSTITYAQIFPEIENVEISEAELLIPKLNSLPERIIQDTLRTVLREKGATNIVERKSDTSLEIADLEDFSIRIGKQWYSFVSIVKGYGSLRMRHVRWEDIAHQITKGYQGTKPDHVLLILAKDTVDGLVTQLVNYGDSVGKRNLIILIDPVTLVRFLRARKIL